MVTAAIGPRGSATNLVLRPHAPLSWPGAVLLFGIVDIPIVAVAVICGLLGSWYVLPFSLLVVAAVAVGLAAGYWRTQRCEVVSVGDEAIAIDKGHRRPEQHFEFPRGWAQVVLERGRPASHLFIRSHGRQVEVGDFLDDEEKLQLADRLRPLIGPARSYDAGVAP